MAWYDQLVVYIVTILSTSLTLVAWPIMIYWVRKVCITHRDKVSKYNRRLVIITWIAIILFNVVITFNSTYAIYVCLISGVDYSKFNSHYKFTSTPIMISNTTYAMSKYFIYVGLYLRLKTLLHDTMFEYKKHKYTRLQILIMISCVMVSFAIGILPYKYYLGFVFGGIYLVLDVIIPVYINVLFVDKIREIRIFVSTQVDPNININKPQHIHGTSSGNLQLSATNSVSPSAKTNNNTYRSDSYNINNNNNNNPQQNVLLYTLMVRCTFIVLTIVLSSLFVLLCVVVRMIITVITGQDLMVTLPIQIFILALDSLINLICLVSYFTFTKELSRIFIDKIFCCCNGLSTSVINRLVRT